MPPDQIRQEQGHAGKQDGRIQEKQLRPVLPLPAHSQQKKTEEQHPPGREVEALAPVCLKMAVPFHDHPVVQRIPFHSRDADRWIREPLSRKLILRPVYHGLSHRHDAVFIKIVRPPVHPYQARLPRSVSVEKKVLPSPKR